MLLFFSLSETTIRTNEQTQNVIYKFCVNEIRRLHTTRVCTNTVTYNGRKTVMVWLMWTDEDRGYDFEKYGKQKKKRKNEHIWFHRRNYSQINARKHYNMLLWNGIFFRYSSITPIVFSRDERAPSAVRTIDVHVTIWSHMLNRDRRRYNDGLQNRPPPPPLVRMRFDKRARATNYTIIIIISSPESEHTSSSAVLHNIHE